MVTTDRNPAVLADGSSLESSILTRGVTIQDNAYREDLYSGRRPSIGWLDELTGTLTGMLLN